MGQIPDDICLKYVSNLGIEDYGNYRSTSRRCSELLPSVKECISMCDPTTRTKVSNSKSNPKYMSRAACRGVCTDWFRRRRRPTNTGVHLSRSGRGATAPRRAHPSHLLYGQDAYRNEARRLRERAAAARSAERARRRRNLARGASGSKAASTNLPGSGFGSPKSLNPKFRSRRRKSPRRSRRRRKRSQLQGGGTSFSSFEMPEWIDDLMIFSPPEKIEERMRKRHEKRMRKLRARIAEAEERLAELDDKRAADGLEETEAAKRRRLFRRRRFSWSGRVSLQ